MKSTSKKRTPSIVNLTVKRRYLTQREIERLMDCAARPAILHCPSWAGRSWWRPDCVAGHVGLELRNVVTNYSFESSIRFPRNKPNSSHRDHSRLSCDIGHMQLR